MMDEKSRDAAKLATVHSGEIDQQLLEELAQDLQSCARIRSVQTRTNDSHQTQVNPEGVGPAVQQLLAGAISALQIRYEFDDVLWTDTIMRIGSGFRLIRIPSNDSCSMSTENAP